MLQKFAKLFDVEDYGQVLCFLDINDEGDPSVKIMFQPPGAGVCSTAFSFNDGGNRPEDEQWSKAESLWDKIDEDYIKTHITPMIDRIASQFFAD